MTHGEAAHERGTHNMFTGYRPSPAVQYPSMGSVVSHEFGPRNNLPPYVCVPTVSNPYAGSGYLSSAYGPFSLGAEWSVRGGEIAAAGVRVAHGRHAHVRWKVVARAEFVAHNASHARVLHR